MVKVISKETTKQLDVNSDEFKIAVKKMLYWQREEGYFAKDEEKEYSEYLNRVKYFFNGFRTEFKFSNGIEKSLIVLNFLYPVDKQITQDDEFGNHYEYISLIAEVSNGEYSLVSNLNSFICVHEEQH